MTYLKYCTVTGGTRTVKNEYRYSDLCKLGLSVSATSTI